MSNIVFQQVDYAGKELGFYVDHATGECFTTARALAALCGVSHQAIKKLISGGNLEVVKNAEVLSMSGLQGGNLITENESFDVIEYYAFDAGKNCKDVAKRNFKVMARAGYRVLKILKNTRC